MRKQWLTISPFIDSLEEFENAGPIGSIVVQASWRIAKSFNLLDGDITPYWRDEFIARLLHFDDLKCPSCKECIGEELIRQGMAGALKSGLVEEHRGTIFSCEWIDERKRAVATERQRRYRARTKEEQKGKK